MDSTLIKKFGSGCFLTGSQLCEKEQDILHISPKIDVVLGGGCPFGNIVTLAGVPKSGKTVLSLHMLAKAQQMGKPVVYINSENRIKKRDLESVNNLNLDNLTIISSYKQKTEVKKKKKKEDIVDGEKYEKEIKIESTILDAESILQIAEHIIHNTPEAVIVIDSISALVTSTELNKELGERAMVPLPLLFSQFLKRVSGPISVNESLLVGIIHMTTNVGGKGYSQIATGGTKWRYNTSVGLECRSVSYIKAGEKIIGQRPKWRTISTAMQAPPNQETDSVIIYGEGIDEVFENVDLGIDLGFISKKSGWYSLDYLGEGEMCNGILNVRDRLKENEDEYKILQDKVNQLIYS